MEHGKRRGLAQSILQLEQSRAVVLANIRTMDTLLREGRVRVPLSSYLSLRARPKDVFCASIGNSYFVQSNAEQMKAHLAGKVGIMEDQIALCRRELSRDSKN